VSPKCNFVEAIGDVVRTPHRLARMDSRSHHRKPSSRRPIDLVPASFCPLPSKPRKEPGDGGRSGLTPSQYCRC
jgi:hypothetical protein